MAFAFNDGLPEFGIAFHAPDVHGFHRRRAVGEVGGRQGLTTGGEDADLGLFPVHEAHQRKLEQARQENRDVQLGGDLALETGHEAAASGNGLHAVGLKLFRGLNERLQQIRSGVEQQARNVHAPYDPRHRRKTVGQRIAHVPARFWEQRFEAQDADGHVVIQSTAFHIRSFGLMRDVQPPRV